MRTIDQQLKKGVLDILILSLLHHNGKMYGYEIIQVLKDMSHDYYALKEGSLYPVLYRLEDRGFIQHEIIYVETKRTIPRKYYSMTGSGLLTLSKYQQAWKDFVHATSSIIDKMEVKK